jgi:hypothetical protein
MAFRSGTYSCDEHNEGEYSWAKQDQCAFAQGTKRDKCLIDMYRYAYTFRVYLLFITKSKKREAFRSYGCSTAD